MANNPVTPTYSKAKPVVNDACVGYPGGGPNADFVTGLITAGGKDAEVLAGTEIGVDDLSDSATDRFRVNYEPLVQLTASLAIIPREASSDIATPMLLGRVIDEIQLDWTYNDEARPVLQDLTNNEGLPVPPLTGVERTYNESGIGVTAAVTPKTVTYTITGNDNLGNNPESIAVDTASFKFGNYLVENDALDQTGLATSGLQTIYDGGIQTIKTSRNDSVFATGGANQHFFIFYPKNWGLATFQKGIFVGGFVRLKNVAGTLKQVLGGGDVEIDITLSNGLGSEPYYVYMTLFDNQVDPTEAIIIS